MCTALYSTFAEQNLRICNSTHGSEETSRRDLWEKYPYEKDMKSIGIMGGGEKITRKFVSSSLWSSASSRCPSTVDSMTPMLKNPHKWITVLVPTVWVLPYNVLPYRPELSENIFKSGLLHWHIPTVSFGTSTKVDFRDEVVPSGFPSGCVVIMLYTKVSGIPYGNSSFILKQKHWKSITDNDNNSVTRSDVKHPLSDSPR